MLREACPRPQCSDRTQHDTWIRQVCAGPLVLAARTAVDVPTGRSDNPAASGKQAWMIVHEGVVMRVGRTLCCWGDA